MKRKIEKLHNTLQEYMTSLNIDKININAQLTINGGTIVMETTEYKK